MEFDIRYDQERDCVIGTVIGNFDRKAAEAYAVEIVMVMSKHDCERLLNDMRRAHIDFSVLGLYDLPQLLSTAGFDLSWRRAIVASGDLEVSHFFETVARNRGHNVMAFVDMDEAMEWLREKR